MLGGKRIEPPSDISGRGWLFGLEAARARGRKGGRKPVMTKAKQETAKAMYSSGRYVSEIAQVLGVSRPTVYKALNQNEMAIA